MESDDLVERVRELAARDPDAAQQVERVLHDAIAALERATGTPFGGGYGEPPVRVADLEAAAEHQRADG
jgi:hypothetical protein